MMSHSTKKMAGTATQQDSIAAAAKLLKPLSTSVQCVSPTRSTIITRAAAPSSNGSPNTSPRSVTSTSAVTVTSNGTSSAVSPVDSPISDNTFNGLVNPMPQQQQQQRNGNHQEFATAAILPIYTPDEVFVCPEESLFYSQCIEKLVVNRSDQPAVMVEFGAGDGSPVISCLLKAPYTGTVHAFELNPAAAGVARSRAHQFGIGHKYQVHNTCFFKGHKQVARGPGACLIANPPYVPAPDNDILMPALWGGVDGAVLTRELLTLGFDRCMLLISAYSNPVLTLQYAAQQGYVVTDFLVTPLPFGYYSSEPKVKAHIGGMKAKGEAFYSERMYILAGVLFEKAGEGREDLGEELLTVMTSLQ